MQTRVLLFTMILNLLLGSPLLSWAQEGSVIEQAANSLKRTSTGVFALENKEISKLAAGTQLELYFPPEVPSISSDSYKPSSTLLTPSIIDNLKATMAQVNRFEINSVLRPNVFQVRGLPSDGVEDTYSGTVFREGGKVYGVVAAHILAKEFDDLSRLMRTFFTDIWVKGERHTLTARAVFVAPVFDLALVEFKPEDAALLDAPELDIQLPQAGETVISQGFIGNQEPVILEREVRDVSPFSIRTNMPWPRTYRGGLCGSRIVNKSGKIVGVHAGSTRKGEDESVDFGLVAPAWQIKRMVEAYENGGASVTMTCDGKEMFELQVDEYVSRIVLFDENGKELWQGRPAFGMLSPFLLHKLLKTENLFRMELTLGRRYFPSPYSSYVAEEYAVRKIVYQVSPRSE